LVVVVGECVLLGQSPTMYANGFLAAVRAIYGCGLFWLDENREG
jgi:hypothetical protein